MTEYAVSIPLNALRFKWIGQKKVSATSSSNSIVIGAPPNICLSRRQPTTAEVRSMELVVDAISNTAINALGALLEAAVFRIDCESQINLQEVKNLELPLNAYSTGNTG